MGVYIPNVEIPRGCNSCPLVMEIDNTCSLTMGGCTKDERPPHCPLIDIVHCGECKHYDFGLCSKLHLVTDPENFCSDGERRTDE